MRETTLFWPWMILTRYTPSHPHNDIQYSVVAFPWSFILFIPFLYVLKASWDIYFDNQNTQQKIVTVIVMSIIQIIILYATFWSQDFKTKNRVESESLKVYFIPQILLIIIYSGLLFKNKLGTKDTTN